VLRIHFTPRDLARIQIAPTLGPLSETLFALSLLRCPTRLAPGFSSWRRQVGGPLATQTRPLTALIPPGSLGVDLCTLVGESATIEQGADALMSIPHERLLTEMRLFDSQIRLPASAWAAADPAVGAREQLAEAARISYRTLVEPYWSRTQSFLQAERAWRGRILMEGGVDRLLSTLHPPLIRWRPPILEIHFAGLADEYFPLNGRGLTLIPSLFVGDIPCVSPDDSNENAPLRLFFAAVRDAETGAALWNQTGSGGDALPALVALVGRTRAAILSRIADGCTTTELAQHTGVSLSAASQHASVLRDAGLITTRRNGSAVLHVLTPLGRELLTGGMAENGQ
jgi:DNA-binding transcriptional ArsR family regulator